MAFASFKPIELVLASPIDPLMDQSSSSDDSTLDLSPMDIFRDRDQSMDERQQQKMDDDNNDQAMRRPLNEQFNEQGDGVDEDAERGRVISPYPFSHTSQQEAEELELLTNSCDWSLQQVRVNDNSKFGGKNISILIDYTRFLEFGGMPVDQVMEDDFSVSTKEANSVPDDFCLASISDNLESFWEDPTQSDRLEP